MVVCLYSKEQSEREQYDSLSFREVYMLLYGKEVLAMFKKLFKKKEKPSVDESIKSLDDYTKELFDKSREKLCEIEQKEKIAKLEQDRD